MARVIADEKSNKPDLEGATWIVSTCADEHAHLAVQGKDGKIAELVMDAEGAYDLAQSLLRAYDVLAGIAGPD